MKFGTPVSLSGAGYQQGQYDPLLTNHPVAPIVSAGVQTFIVIPINSYDSLTVFINGVSNALWVQIVNNSVPNSPIFSAAVSPRPGPWTTVLPCIANAGDAIAVNIYFSGSGGNGNITVVGLTNTPPPPYRTDGRSYPLGIFLANGAAQGNTNPIVSNGATNGQRMMLRSMTVSYNNAGTQSNVYLLCTINGNANTPLYSANLLGTSPIGVGGGAFSQEWESGLLLDAGTGISAQSSNVSAIINASLQFDLVPA